MEAVVQVLGADFCEFKTADCLIDSHQKVNVSVDGRRTNTGLFFQVQHILGILRKGLMLVNEKTVVDLLSYL